MTLTLIDPRELARKALFPVTEVAIPKPRRMYNFNQTPVNDGYEFPNTFIGNETKYKMLIREDTGEPISIMTDQYKLIQNADVLDMIANSVNATGMVRISEVNVFSGARTKITFDTERTKSIRGDSIATRFTLFNSYDGTGKISIRPSLLRLICLNGAVTSHEFGMVAYRHMKHLDVKNCINNLIKDAIELIDTSIAAEIELMMNTQITVTNNILEFVSYFPEKYRESVVANLAESEKNYWSMLNAATYVLTHIANRDNESTHKIESYIYLKALQMAKGEIKWTNMN